mgnify:CR=1 FL=1
MHLLDQLLGLPLGELRLVGEDDPAEEPDLDPIDRHPLELRPAVHHGAGGPIVGVVNVIAWVHAVPFGRGSSPH